MILSSSSAAVFGLVFVFVTTTRSASVLENVGRADVQAQATTLEATYNMCTVKHTVGKVLRNIELEMKHTPIVDVQ